MKAIDRPFTKIINGTTQFVIPVFQRDYSWSETQCEQLWNDVLRVADGDQDAVHFLGSVVYAPTGDTSAGFTRWLLIDGQQRMTTLIILLTALRDHIIAQDWAGGEDDPTAARINAYFLENVQEEGNRRRKLVLRRFDQATLAAIVEGSEPPDQVSERIRDNYDFFRDQLEQTDPAEVYRGVGRLVVVDVSLDARSDNPQLVFESLNSTGLDLSQSDLIRNYILMSLGEREQTRLYEDYWHPIERLFRGSERAFDAFARDYMALSTEASKQEKGDQIYRAFREFFPRLQQERGETEEALAEMLRQARYYAAFITGADGFPTLGEPLARLRRLVDVPAMLVMRLFDCYDRLGTLSEEDFQEALGLIESYIFRRAIVGLQTRGYWSVFANMAYRISDQHPLEDLRVALARQHDSYRYPSDDEFRTALSTRDLYGLRVCRVLLETLENHGSKEPSDTSGYSIEHIMPQNKAVPPEWRTMLGENWERVHETWVHRLGNLTVTGYNSTYSDRPFSEKKEIPGGFSESAVRLNRFVREQSSWNEEVIRSRTADLTRRSLAIWPELKVEQHLIDAARQRELAELAERRDVGKVRMSQLARQLFSELSKAVCAMDSDVLEVAEGRSVSYYQGPHFFLEVLPRKHRLMLLLPMDFREIEDEHDLAEDATQWKFFFYAQHQGGVALRIDEEEHVALALPVIQQARALAGVVNWEPS